LEESWTSMIFNIEYPFILTGSATGRHAIIGGIILS